MQVSSQAVSESYILGVAVRQPSVFVSPSSYSQPVFDVAACNGQYAGALQPLALNADGTQNSCANPAASGSVVTIFLNGLGLTIPAQTTGMVSTSATAINPVASLVTASASGTDFLSTATVPGSIDGVAQVQIQVASPSYVTLAVEVQESGIGYWVRGPGIAIWVH